MRSADSGTQSAIREKQISLSFPKFFLSSCITYFAKSGGASSYMEMLLSVHKRCWSVVTTLLNKTLITFNIDGRGYMTRKTHHLKKNPKLTVPLTRNTHLLLQNKAILVHIQMHFPLCIHCYFVYSQSLT